jgi:AcrR family transcriptional regulator
VTPRPRKASDDEVLAATARVMGRVGPAQLTLGAIAAEAGVTAGALVQRFGSKRALMLTLMERFAGSTDAMFAALRSANPSPLAAVLAYGDCFAEMGASPGALAHHLAYLQVDITDPDYHRYVQVQAIEARRALQQLLDDAVATGELPAETDTAALARAVQVTVSGSLMTWALVRDGTAREAIRRDLGMVLGLATRIRRP